MNVHSKQAQALTSHDQHQYDSTERAVGAVVLFSLMMILYFVLKAMLGISETGPEYALSMPLQVELIPSTEMVTNNEANNTDPAAEPEPFSNEFVFLNLDGKPMKDGDTVVNSAYANNADPTQEQWYIQAASFKEKQAAEKLTKRLKTNKFTAYVVKSGDWYVVRLQSETDDKIARKQLRDLKNSLRINGILRHIKPN